MDSVRDGRPSDARGGKQILGIGTNLRFGRDQFDVDDYTTSWPRSGRRVSQLHVGDHFFQCAFSLSEISFSSVPSFCWRPTRGFKRLHSGRAFLCSYLNSETDLREVIKVPLHDEIFESHPAFQGCGHILTPLYVVKDIFF